MRLLLCEDEKELAHALAAILKHNNYSVDIVYDGEEALDFGLSGNYDGIILDIMMPKMSGTEVLRQLRAQHIDVPVLFLTAKSQIEDKINGLDLGADDYLTKPCNTGELLARIRAMTRRRTEYAPNILSFGNMMLDRSNYELCVGEKKIKFSNKEYQMIEMLMENPNRLISTEQFMERIWGYDSDAEINVVWVYISFIRKKLVVIGADAEIKASRGIGYKLVQKQGH